jgi:hypothetical protein
MGGRCLRAFVLDFLSSHYHLSLVFVPSTRTGMQRVGCTRIFAAAMLIIVISGFAILGLSFTAFVTYTPMVRI